MALFQRTKSPFADNEPGAQKLGSAEAQSVGDLLRRQRLALDIDVGDAAAALKIKPAYLAAIEEGRPDQLPGATYALGFVRSYSEYLGLDSEELLRRFKFEAAELNAKPDLTFPMPLNERSVPAGRVLAVALILAACSYGIWYHLTANEWVLPERVAEVPTELLPSKFGPSIRAKVSASAVSNPSPERRSLKRAAVDLTATQAHLPAAPVVSVGRSPVVKELNSFGSVSPPASATSANPEPSELTRVPIVSPRPATVAADALHPPPGLAPAMAAAPAKVGAAHDARPSSASTPAMAPPSVSADPGPLPSVPSRVAVTGAPSAATAASALNRSEPLAGAQTPKVEGTRTPAVPGDRSRITVRASADSWIQIRAADHSALFTGVLKPGDIYRVPDRPDLTMRVGNAGGIDIMIDGKPTPPLGPMGAVRNVSLDPATLSGQSPAHN
jgi:cytoskeleton protein RodZ